MLDANGRPIEVGDYVTLAGRDIHVAGKVIELFCDGGNGFVHLGDGLVFHDFEVITWANHWWVICQLCYFTWPADRLNENEECPDCGPLLLIAAAGEDTGESLLTQYCADYY